MTFGERIAEARKEKQLTQKKLAEIMGVSPMRINHYENNNREPDIESIKKLSDILDINPDWLIGLSEHKKRLTVSRDELNNMLKNPRRSELLEAIAKMSDVEFDRFYKAFFALFGESNN